MAGISAFTIYDGQIIEPNGNAFNARGINISEYDMGSVDKILADFPGINFIRLNLDKISADPSQYQAFVSKMTSKGIVVELEDHAWPAPHPYTGSALSNEISIYASLATAFKGNSYVWFGTLNEPQTNYGSAEAAVTTQEVATYNAIRGTGNNTIIMMELMGGGNPGTIGDGFGMTASSYASMTNIVWDEHFYGWAANFSTDQNTVNAALAGSASNGTGIAAAQTIKSADGIVPVIIGEYGPSTDGVTVDLNGDQVIAAVQKSGAGNVSHGWHFDVADALVDDISNLTAYGQEVSSYFATAGQTANPSKATDTLVLRLSEDAWQGDAQCVISIDGKTISGTVTVTASHAAGKTQAVTLIGLWGPGVHDVGVQFRNDARGGTAATDRNLYVNSVVLDGQASNGTPVAQMTNGTAHVATGASPLVLQLSEDAYRGDAQFTVAVDGKSLGLAQTVSASHAKGAVQNFAFAQAMTAGTHDVAVSFLNDAYGGTVATDRNLYVQAITANGAALPGTAASLLNTTTQHFSITVAAHA